MFEAHVISNLDYFKDQEKEYRHMTVHGSPDLLNMSCLITTDILSK